MNTKRMQYKLVGTLTLANFASGKSTATAHQRTGGVGTQEAMVTFINPFQYTLLFWKMGSNVGFFSKYGVVLYINWFPVFPAFIGPPPLVVLGSMWNRHVNWR